MTSEPAISTSTMEPSSVTNNTTNNNESDIPSLPWDKKEPVMLGIDEAGRGPVLGPMVYAAAFCPIKEESKLNALGADDSKQLTEEQRDALRLKIDGANSFLLNLSCVLSAKELSEKMLRKVRVNLNLISHDAALNLVEQALNIGANVTQVYVDTVGNADTYAEKFRSRFPKLDKVVVAKKADATYRIVGAASIVAKTTRDHIIKQWQFEEMERSIKLAKRINNDDLIVQFSEKKGSGYPSDPNTKKWMEDHCDKVFGFPTFVRFSWGTTKTILEKRAVQVDWESDEEEVSEPVAKQPRVKTKDIKSFFSGNTSKASSSVSSKGKQLNSNKTTAKHNSVRPIYPTALKSLSLKRATSLM